MKRRQKSGFLSPLSSKIILTKEKERSKRKNEEEKRRRRKKKDGCTLRFYNGYFRASFWPEKKTVGRKKSIWRERFFKSPAKYALEIFFIEISSYLNRHIFK